MVWRVAACALLMALSAVLAQTEEGAGASGEAAAVAQDEATEAGDAATLGDDGRRTFGKLPANFGRGVVGVFSLDNLVPFLGGVVATTLAHQIDGGFVPGSDNDFNNFGQGFGNPLVVAVAATGVFVAGRIADGPTFRNMSYDLFLATGVTLLYTEAIKLAVDRTRPDQSNQNSFPSGHTSNGFVWATVLDHHYGWKLGVPMYIVAGFIGVTRVDRGSHFFSDVVAGAAIGFIVGRTITRVNGKPVDEPRLSVMPIVGPSGQRGLALRIVY
jgi:membrane-associated phospholipid phosphatase